MDYRFLGNSGLKVSELCLGASMTMNFGKRPQVDSCHRILDMYVDSGGNFLDTANTYAKGTSEEILGHWLKNQRRDRLVVATKVRFPTDDGPNDLGLSRKHILQAVDNSLRRLQTDYIDLYQLHCWDHITPLEETLGTLGGLVKTGKVRYIGASNFTGWQLQKAADLSLWMKWERFISLQPLYNLLDRSIEWELVPVCLNEGLGINPWSPLRCGWLTGQYRREMGKPPTGSRIEHAEASNAKESWSAYDSDRNWAILDVLFAVSEETGKSPSQVALNWLLHRPGVTAPVIGPQEPQHLEDNLGACGWTLNPDQVDRLTNVSSTPLPYPYDNVAAAERRR
jgi:aryl-alcohol dehydrogenase-like predicted oxidoreductase